MGPPAIDGQILAVALSTCRACGALLRTLSAGMVAKVCLELAFINVCVCDRAWAETAGVVGQGVGPFCLLLADLKSLM